MPEQKPRSQRMVERLRQLRTDCPDIEASAIVSLDGLIVASDLPATTEEDRVSALSAAMLSLGERISTDMGRGQLDQVYIHGTNGYVFLMSIGNEAVLTVLARREAKLGIVLFDTRLAATDIAKMM